MGIPPLQFIQLIIVDGQRLLQLSSFHKFDLFPHTTSRTAVNVRGYVIQFIVYTVIGTLKNTLILTKTCVREKNIIFSSYNGSKINKFWL